MSRPCGSSQGAPTISISGGGVSARSQQQRRARRTSAARRRVQRSAARRVHAQRQLRVPLYENVYCLLLHNIKQKLVYTTTPQPEVKDTSSRGLAI